MSHLSEAQWRGLVWGLLGAAVVMRCWFHIRVARRGEKLLPDGGAIRREGGTAFVIRVAGFVMLVGLLAGYFLGAGWLLEAGFHLPGFVRLLALSCAIVALALWTWTQVVLGRYWSAQLALRDKHELVTWGPYKYVRHPMYTAIFVWISSLAIVAANWFFVLAAAGTIAVLLVRTPKEENMMLSMFSARYQEYMKHTGRYLPRL
jgi:protein-S-isoprenylcysteine O-methyltransferase Ste14